MNKRSLLTLLSALTLTGAAHATLLLQENFNDLTIGGLNGQNGWTAGSGLNVAAGGLSYSNGLISISGGANHATWSGVNTNPLGSKEFASQSGDVWFSLTLNVVATNTSSRFWFFVSDDATLNNSGVMGQITDNSTALQSGARIGSNQAASSPTSGYSFTQGNLLGQTLFLVGRYSKTGTNYDTMEMWVNPDSANLVNSGANYFRAQNAVSGGIASGIDTFALSALGTGSSVQWDNLLVGTTRADVLDVYVIPEPSVVLLVGLGAVALILRRAYRRREAR